MKCVRVIMHWRVISDCGWRMAEDCCLARPRQCLYLHHSPSSSPPPHHHPHQNSKSLPKIKNLFSCLPLYSNIPLFAIMCRIVDNIFIQWKIQKSVRYFVLNRDLNVRSADTLIGNIIRDSVIQQILFPNSSLQCDTRTEQVGTVFKCSILFIQ